MNHTFFTRLSCLACACAIIANAYALPADRFATESKLASGHWVKIAVSETGVYQITYDQLREMGFSNPESVVVYGFGGRMHTENFSTTLSDDLQAIPALRSGNKLIFYGEGPVAMTLDNSLGTFTRENHAYTSLGHYFLSQEGGQNPQIATKPYNSNATSTTDSSTDYFIHEEELATLSFAGKELLGENIFNQQPVFNYNLVNLSENKFKLTSAVALRASLSSNASATDRSYGNFSCKVNSGGTVITAPYPESECQVPSCTEFIFYREATPTCQIDLPATNPTGTIVYTPFHSGDKGFLRNALLDYFIITFNHSNRFAGQADNQFRMAFNSIQAQQAVALTDATDNAVVWNVTCPTAPVQMELAAAGTGRQFTPEESQEPAQFVAFDPTKTLKSIDSYEAVENQNLHAMPVPQMVIITNQYFMPQAERLAQLHRDHENLDVVVVDQQQIFNEFSSGNPDAMGIRLFNKMLFDRDNRYRLLLMFGHGTFDNRGLISKKPNCVLTYEATNSYNEDYAYVTDDFFAFLLDDGPNNDSNEKNQIQLGVGRITPSTISEAISNVDKITEYVLNPDYGPWRNNVAAWADKGNDCAHSLQASGILNTIVNGLNTGMVDDRAFVAIYPGSVYEAASGVTENNRQATSSKERLKEMLATGQYFITYIGHANATKFSVSSNLWLSSDAQTFTFPHLPVMTTACCDVARYDSDHRGITEHMFHNRNGGAIALFTTSRQVYSNSNDVINNYIVNAMFADADNDITLGDVYRIAKQRYGFVRNTNKLQWWLLGDPAIKVSFPQNRFRITQFNGQTVTPSDTFAIAPMQRVSIVANVLDAAGNPDRGFNGEAYLTLFDAERIYRDYVRSVLTDIGLYPREQLVQIKGTVNAGVFRAEFVVPRYTQASADKVLISIYAHDTANDKMVNGRFQQVYLDLYDGYDIVTDDNPPVINAMYLNDERTFAANATTGTSPILYVQAQDDVAFNTQTQAMGNNITLMLDGGKQSYNLVKNYITLTDNGRRFNLAFPMSGLNPGRHSLSVTLHDIGGNPVSKTINFVVNAQSNVLLTAEKLGSASEAVFDLNAAQLGENATVALTITDPLGNLIKRRVSTDFPFTWDLTDSSGRRVPAGLYKISANYESNEGYGGTNIINFVVLNPVAGN